jgi:hypothetical protein
MGNGIFNLLASTLYTAIKISAILLWTSAKYKRNTHEKLSTQYVSIL